MTEEKKKKGFDQFAAAAKKAAKVEVSEVSEESKKVNWMRLIRLVFKLLEPELRKLHPVWMIVPITLLYCQGFGIYKFGVQIVDLVNYIINAVK